MAKKPIAEFAGTDNEVIDPASIAGTDDGNNSGGSGDDFDPAIHVGRDKRNADGSYTRKRGRKTGSGTGARKKTDAPNLAGIETILLSMHQIMAAAIKTPELVLDEKEAKAMADAIAEVARYYPMTIDPKTLAWINLASCSAMIYGPRIYLISARKKEEAKERENEAHDRILVQ